MAKNLNYHLLCSSLNFDWQLCRHFFPTAGVAEKSENSDSAADLSWEVLNRLPNTFLLAGSLLFPLNKCFTYDAPS